jgi:hypothetical protein
VCEQVKITCSQVRIVGRIVFFKSSVMRDGRPDRFSSWTFVLPSLNIRHHFLTFTHSYTFPTHYNRLTGNFIPTDILCIQEPNYCLTSHSAGFLIFFLICKYYKNYKTIESARHLFGLLLKDYWGPLILKWYNSLIWPSAKRKRSLLSGRPSCITRNENKTR